MEDVGTARYSSNPPTPQELLEQIDNRLEALRSFRWLGEDSYTSGGRWVSEAHDAAQALGLLRKPARPTLDEWTFESERAALDALRVWLEGHLDDPWSKEFTTQKRWCEMLDHMAVNTFRSLEEKEEIRVWRVMPRRLTIRLRNARKYGYSGD